MASFPNLRPHRRSAKAGSRAARRTKPAVLLAVSAALLLTASLAVSEFATLRGAKAHDASAFLTRELGPPLDSAPLVRTPAHDLEIRIDKRGLAVRSSDRSVGLSSLDVHAGNWRRYEHGVARDTSFGLESITVHGLRTEQALQVQKPQGPRTWRWELSTTLRPRLAPNGTVQFIDPKTWGIADLKIAPVKIYDGSGKDVTPKNLTWSLGGTKTRPRLELALDDAQLPRPYIIDPIVIRSATAGVGFTSTNSGGAQTASLSLTKPSGAVTNDLFIAHVTVQMSGTALTIVPPDASWTLIRQTNNGTTVSVATYWHAYTGAADTGPYTFTWQNPPGTGVNRRSAGGITAYANTAIGAPIDASFGATGASGSANVTGITTAGTNEMIFYAEGNQVGRTQTTPPTIGGGAMTERYDTSSTATAANADRFSAAKLTAASTTGQALSGGGSPSWAAQVIALLPDVTAPTNNLSLSSVSPAGTAYLSGTTLYYRGAGPNCAAETQVAGRCSFKVSNAVSDAASGPASSTFAALGGTSTGWLFTGSTVSTPAGGPYDSNFLSWASGTSSGPTELVTGTDNNANTNTGTTLTFQNDITAPSVSAPTVTAGYYTSLSVGVTLNGGSDGGSGLAAGSSVVQRDEATLSSGNCGSFSGSWTNVTLTGGNDTTVLNGKCYQYREQLSDTVGNTGSSSASSIAKVDNAGPSNSLSLTSVSPSGSALKSGNTVYYRGVETGGGSFKIRNAVSDPESGPASSQTAALGGTTTGWTHTGSTVSTPAGGPYDSNDFTWAQGTTSSPTEVVTGRDAAGNATAAATLNFADDSNAPTGGAVTVNGTAATGGGSSSYDTDGSFTIGTRTDYAETQSGSESGLASSTLVRTSATFSSPDTCGSFGSPSTITGNPDQNGLTTGCYRYTLTGTDNVGNAVSISTTVKVDTSDPAAPTLAPSNATGGAYYPGSGTRVYFKPDAANGGFDLSASSSDSDTGIASYGFPAGSSLGTNWSDSGSGSSRTYSYTATATSNGSQNVSATNNAGGSASSSFDVTLDSTAPSGGALTVNGTAGSGGGTTSYDTDGNFTIGTRTDYSESQTSSESGLASSTLVRTSASFSAADVCGAFGSPSTITGNPDQSGLSTGCYRYTLTGTDNVGNAVSISTTVKVDTSAPSTPSLTLANATGGSYYPGSGTRVFFKPDAANGGFDATASSTDSDTGIASYTFPAGGSIGTNWSTSGSGATRTYSYTGTATTNGSQNVTATNNAGGTSGNGTFDVTADSTAPAGGSVTVNGTAATGGTSVSYDTDGSFPIDSRTDYSETASATASGLASSTLVRTSATFASADTCGAFGSPSTITGNPSQSGLSTGCYKYTLTGTDNVGNTVSVATIVKVDTSDPSDPSLSISSATGGTHYPGAGTQIFFKPSAASGGFDLTASSSDADTGIFGYTFPTAGSMGTNWTASGSGAARTYSFTPTAGEPGTKSVSASNNAGGSASSNFTVTADSTAPTTTIQCNGAACLNGSYYTSAPVSVTLSGNDGSGSGVQKIRYTTDGTDPTLINGSDYTGAISINSTATVKFRAYDNVGNEEAAGSQEVLLDGTPPSVSLTVTENPASGAQHVSGMTLFYRPGAAGGTFRVAADAQDPETGIASVDFPSIANVTGGGSQTSSPYREDYTWNASTTNAASHNVVATNGAGTTTPEPFTLTQDSAAPSGQSITLTGADAPYYGSASVGFSLGDGNDPASGSGLDTSTRTVTRESAPLNADNCGTFSADAGTYTSPDTAVSGGNCYRYTFTIADNVGNVSSAVTATAKVDTDDPSVSLTDPGTPVAGTVALSATASDPSTSVQQVVFERAPAGGSTWTTIGTDTIAPYSANWDTTALSDGLYDVRAVATDATNHTAASLVVNRRVDNTSPDTTIDSSPADPSNDTTPTFTFSSSETGSSFECRVDGGSWSSCSSPETLSALGAGSHTFDVRATDQAGNTDATPASRTWTIDLTAPNTTIDSNPADPSNDTTPTFGFSSSEGSSTFECRIDGGSWSSCTSPNTVSPALGAGSHTFEVRATDQAGNTDATPASYTWTIDLTAPNTTIDSNPTDPSNDTTPTFAFSANEGGSTFECRVDGGSWSSCSSPETLAALAAGSHTFEVRATDVAGNTDATPASYTWTIDLTAPNTSIDSSPPAVDNDSTPNFTFSSSESGSSFECRIDSGNWASCTSPHTISPALTEGSHTFDVRATDQAGNTDATPASHTWTVDLGPPSVTITSPTTYLNGSDPTTYPVAASSPDGDVTRVDFYECSNGSTDCATGTWTQFGTDNSTPYSADWSTPGADGPKAIRAVAVDAGANTGEHVRTITIDRTGPTGVTVSYPNNYVFGSFSITTDNGTDPDVNASSGVLERRTGDLANDSCSSYSGWAAASSPDTLASTKCAQYRYRLADNAGNWTTATSSNEVKSDTNAPTSIQADPGANLRQTVNLTAVASDTGGSGLTSVAFQHRPSGGGSWTTIATDTTSPYGTAFDTTSVADGLYDFRAVATDVAGSSEASPVVVANRRIDNTAPSATMLSPGNPVRGTVTLTSSTSDTGGSGISTVAYELAPNGGSFNSQPASWDTTLVSDGLYDLHVIATDVAGNSTTSALITTRVDNTPPAVDFTSPAAVAVVSGTVNLVASASDASPASPAVSFAYKLSSDPPGAYTVTGASWDTTALPAGDGLYDVRARATDDAGNTTSVEHANIRVDNAPPTVAITAPPAAINGSVPSPTTFSANATDPGGSGVDEVQFFECSNQSADCATGVWSSLGTVVAPGPYSVSWTIPGADGNHALAAVATDNAGHPASAIRNVDVDRNAPNTTIVSKPADPSNAVTPTFTFTSSETGSTFECSVDGGAFAPCTSPHNISGLTDNTHTFDVRATDAAGNTDATPATWTWHRDTNNPIGTLDNPGANIRQTVTLTSTESDPTADGYASGLASVSYEYSANGTTWALIGTLNAAPFDSMIWNTTAIADGVYELRIVVNDVAGNVTNSAAVPNVRIDNTPPTTSQDDPGQYLRATKPLTASAADSGSGIDHVDFERAPTGGGSWTLVATDSTPGDGFGVSFDTTTVADGHYDFRTVAYDVAGNQAAATPVTDRLVDNTPPNATISSPGAYMRGAVNLTSSTGDPGGSNASGVVSVAYEYSTNGGGSWLPTGSSFDTTAVADGNVDLHVVATDAAGNTTTSPSVTSLIDNTKPATTDNAPAGWQSSTVTVTLTPNDAGSGVNVTEYSVDGDPTYTVGTTVVIPAPANGSNDGAHTIAYFSVDNAGNIETVKSTTVLIDATPPACPSCSAADYLRGTVTLSASPSESGSGIQSVEFEYTDAGGSSWTPIGTDTTGPAPYTVDWNTVPVPDGHYDLRIRVTDNANNVTTTNLPDKVVDNTAPDLANVGAPTEGQLVTGTIAIAASASDVTSPIASVRFYVQGSLLGTDTTAPFSMNWNTTTGPDGGATIQVVVEDMAGNSTSSSVRNVWVDNVSPTPTLADPGQNLSGTASLSASSDGDTMQVDFERRPAGGGSWVTIDSDTTLPWGASLDTTALADGLYDFRAVATDQSGNGGASPVRSNIRIDNTNPAGSITTPANGATIGGSSVALGGSYSDGGSGVASVQYDLRPTGGGSWSAIATSTSAPFNATWDATTVATGSYDLRPFITDRSGNTFTGATITVNVDVSAPTVVLTNPGGTISGVVTLNATVSGSGATQVAFSSTPAAGAAWASIGTDTSSPWSTGFDTTKLADGVYDLRAVVSDGLGNTSNDVVTNIRIDNTAPRVVSSTPSDGQTVPSASAVGLVTDEPATPIGVTLDGSSTVAPVISGTNIDYNTGSLGVGPHTLAGELQDSSGKKTPFRVHFTVWSSSGSLAPHVDKNTSSGSSTTVESADGFSAATMPAGAWTTSTSDWIVLRITPMAAPSGLTNGFTAGPHALDVTARWALAGTEVHQFSQPIGILIRSTEKGLVPATFENGNWRVISRVPTAGTLPAGWEDGFYADGSGFHLMTKHLSVFALLHDVEAPNPPQNVRGFLGSNGLTIRWTEGADNSGTYDFVTVFSDSTDIGHYGVDYIAASIGAWAAGDPRVFKLKETDLAGNESALTKALVPVPSLVGKTPDQAADALRARGFTLGTLTTGGNGTPGTITGPEGLVLAEEGAAIDVTVAPGSALSKLVFRVHTAPKFKPAVRKKIAARVSVTRAARVTAELRSPRGVKIYTWRFSVRAGRSIVKLNIPRQVRRPGIYSMRWTARAGRDLASTRLKIRMVGVRVVKFAEPIEVVLSGQAPKGAGAKLPKRKPKVVLATGVETTFDAAANRKTDARVIVVDVDEFGVAFVRDLHTVFPAVKIVALSSSPRTMARALKAGAVIALPRSTPPATLAKVIQKLLASPKKATKPKPAHRSQGPPAKN